MPIRRVAVVHELLSSHTVNCRDDEEREVIVNVSNDVVREFGWDQGFEVASDMFDAGRFSDKKNPAIVAVRVQDVRAWLARQN